MQKHNWSFKMKDVLPAPEIFPAFFDLVAHGPHVNTVIDLLKVYLSALTDDDLSQLKPAVTSALGGQDPHLHTKRFYQLFRTFEKTVLLREIVPAWDTQGNFPTVSIPVKIASILNGSEFVGPAKDPYQSASVFGLIVKKSDRYLQLTCFTGSHWADPLNALPPHDVTLLDITKVDIYY